MPTPSRALTLVTGGSRGIGAATAVHLAEQGHDVVVGYRSGRAEAEEVVAAVVSRGVRGVAVRADVTDPVLRGRRCVTAQVAGSGHGRTTTCR
ncbi:MAG TPA: SDR family NAD(P)-dependent oxidoreductase [Modestobacter sp.]|nr:SDR family NAD(P)-dependent oxidoreductase [Modestobacter sp.]